MIRQLFNVTYQTGRRIVVTLVGTSVLLIGIVMIVMPGPAFIVIPIGLAILAIEFVWARRWLQQLRQWISRRGAEQRGERAEQRR